MLNVHWLVYSLIASSGGSFRRQPDRHHHRRQAGDRFECVANQVPAVEIVVIINHFGRLLPMPTNNTTGRPAVVMVKCEEDSYRSSFFPFYHRRRRGGRKSPRKGARNRVLCIFTVERRRRRSGEPFITQGRTGWRMVALLDRFNKLRYHPKMPNIVNQKNSIINSRCDFFLRG